MKKIMFMFFGFFVLFIFVSCTSAEKTEKIEKFSGEKHSILVTGVRNEIGIKEWEDNRIGFGLRIKLSELLYETGRFEMVEEKDDIKQKLEEIAKIKWIAGEEDEEAYKILTKETSVEYIAYGKVYYFGRPKRNASVGLVQFNKNITEIKVEVTIENLKTGKKITEKGFGSAEVNADSIIFSYTEDKVELDKTTVGIATEKALREALVKIVKKMK